MNLTLAPTTRMAIRAAAVALAATLLTHVWHLQRSYWVVLTGVVLINETWGESVRRVVSRLGMTALGCVVGWVLYELVAQVPGMRQIALLTCVGLAVYFRAGLPASGYNGMIFFISVYVVFLFALLGQWTTDLLLVRVGDTAIGCALALVASRVVLPQQATGQLEADLAEFWEQCRQFFEKASAPLCDPQAPQADLQAARRDLLNRLETMQARRLASAYESLFDTPARARQAALLTRAEMLSRYALGFAAALQASRGQPLPPGVEAELCRDATEVRASFRRLGPKAPEATRPAQEDSSAAGPSAPLASPAELEYLGPVRYYLERILAVLEEFAR